MGGLRKKTGKEFETLVACINEHLHKIATVTPDDRIPDRDTGEPRQVDISIRIADGPSKFLGIVEVRDRSRPVGKEYIEQISAKRQSVRANAACIVSKSGFWKSAQKKAKALGIGTFTYKEAIKSDWSGIFTLSGFSVYVRRYDNVKIFFLHEGTLEIINPYPALHLQIKENPTAQVLLDRIGQPITSLSHLAHNLINHVGDHVYAGIKPGDPPVRRRLLNEGKVEPPLFFRGEDGELYQVRTVLVVANIWIEERRSPVHIQQYKDLESGEVHAEVASSELEIGDERYKAQLIALEPTEFRTQDTDIILRFRKI